MEFIREDAARHRKVERAIEILNKALVADWVANDKSMTVRLQDLYFSQLEAQEVSDLANEAGWQVAFWLQADALGPVTWTAEMQIESPLVSIKRKSVDAPG